MVLHARNALSPKDCRKLLKSRLVSYLNQPLQYMIELNEDLARFMSAK